MNELFQTNPVDSCLRHLSRRALLAALACLSALSATGQPFSNMDFEAAGSRTIPSDSIWLSWQLAAPGWQHAAGADTFFVFHKVPDARQTQCYFLVDSQSKDWSPLAGNYSFGLTSGYFSSLTPNPSWVKASISQDGVIPSDARSFSLLATGDFSVSIGSTEIPMSRAGGNLFSGDVSSFAGESVTLRIVNEALDSKAPLILDNMTFSATAVPEPGSALLLPIGALFLLATAKRLRSRSQTRG